MTEVTLIWDGDDADERSAPSGEDVREQIARLDGTTHTLVMIERDGETLAVGGSQAGMIVYAEGADGAFWQVLSPETSSDDPVVVVAGGQPSEYPAKFVTTVDAAVAAATEFAASGHRSEHVDWERT